MLPSPARFSSALIIALSALACGARAADNTAPAAGPALLRVCADGNNMPQSNSRGEGYENKIAAALARDLGRKVEYTFFPQRMGFVRNTLRSRDEATQQYKCDVIIGVPKGYELTATTQPYMHSTYALVTTEKGPLAGMKAPEDLLKLPPEKLQSLRIGFFEKTPASDWALKHSLLDKAVLYPAQSGDPNVTVGSIVADDLAANKIDAAILWGPIAGYVVSRHGNGAWVMLPFSPDPNIRFDYEISMGVRQGENEWKATLDRWIAEHQADITQILTSFHIPLIQSH
jgi:quinoprotein dehydrogenase-associated probable ABC transporter substrate-binding protein